MQSQARAAQPLCVHCTPLGLFFEARQLFLV
jgi:hypothetical protein